MPKSHIVGVLAALGLAASVLVSAPAQAAPRPTANIVTTPNAVQDGTAKKATITLTYKCKEVNGANYRLYVGLTQYDSNSGAYYTASGVDAACNNANVTQTITLKNTGTQYGSYYRALREGSADLSVSLYDVNGTHNAQQAYVYRTIRVR